MAPERTHERDDPRQALAVPHLRRTFHCQRLERALPGQPRPRADRAVGRLRPADPDRLRQRPRAGARRGRQGRGAGQSSRRHARALRGHPARDHEHLDDDQRHGGLAAGALCRGRRGAGGGPGEAPGHGTERHHQGVPQPRHLRVPARAVAEADRRRGRLLLPRGAEVEPDERLLLPPAGGGRDAGAGTRLRARHRHRSARPGARPGRPPPISPRSSAGSPSS